MASKSLIRKVTARTLRDVGSRYSTPTSSSSCRAMAMSWPRLESAAGRARKRRLRIEKTKTISNDEKRSMKSPRSVVDNEEVVVPPYPNGQPWRVLWPSTHHLTSDATGDLKSVRYLPTWSELKHGWMKYMETWEDGLRGEPSAEKLRQRQVQQSLMEMDLPERRSTEETDFLDVNKIQSNVSRNIKHAKENAQEIFEQAKDSKDDLQKIAGESMKLATVCLKEFMSGYRQGRDQEIDKMLNEYFHDKPTPDLSIQDEEKFKPRKSKFFYYSS